MWMSAYAKVCFWWTALKTNYLKTVYVSLLVVSLGKLRLPSLFRLRLGKKKSEKKKPVLQTQAAKTDRYKLQHLQLGDGKYTTQCFWILTNGRDHESRYLPLLHQRNSALLEQSYNTRLVFLHRSTCPQTLLISLLQLIKVKNFISCVHFVLKMSLLA